MKSVVYFPLAYIANVHGFILLVPYLVFCLMLLRMLQVRRKNREMKLARVRVQVR
jgi:4-hydroxybenzoate polyprenyltransferase